jgi:uncharacterized protein (TIGR02757 family)
MKSSSRMKTMTIDTILPAVSFTEDLKGFLDEMVDRINVPSFIQTDPVQFVHRYSLLQDREVVAFIVATITWGKRSLILNSASRMLEQMGDSPYDFVCSGKYEKFLNQNIHRTFFTSDLIYLCKGIKSIYQERESLEPVFSQENSMWDGIASFRYQLALANAGVFSKHVSNPDANSACKRLHLALRWLVRNDGFVDLGLWKNISPTRLYIPLDVHVGRVSRQLGLLSRKQDDRKSVELLTKRLLDFSPDDPVRYDYALFGIGESEKRR